MGLGRVREGMQGPPADSPVARAVALSADDQHFLAQLAFDRPLSIDLEREMRLTADGLIERRYGRLELTLIGRELLGLGPEPH